MPIWVASSLEMKRGGLRVSAPQLATTFPFLSFSFFSVFRSFFPSPGQAVIANARLIDVIQSVAQNSGISDGTRRGRSATASLVRLNRPRTPPPGQKFQRHGFARAVRTILPAGESTPVDKHLRNYRAIIYGECVIDGGWRKRVHMR